MTSTTHTTELTGPSRTPLIAAIGIAASALLTAMGTFWAVNDSPDAQHNASGWVSTLGVIAVAAAVVYGLVVRTAATGNPGRRAVVLGVVAFLSNVVFWAGLPMVLASAAIACAFIEKDKRSSFGPASKVALALAAVTAVPAVTLAIWG